MTRRIAYARRLARAASAVCWAALAVNTSGFIASILGLVSDNAAALALATGAMLAALGFSLALFCTVTDGDE